MERVYLDNAATTKVLPEVVEAMLPYYTEYYGNPSSFHSFAREAHKGLDESRRIVAKCLNAAEPSEIVFTGGGSEGDNMILRGAARAYFKKGKHFITTAIEHHAILHTLGAMEAEGIAEVTYLPVDKDGLVTPEQVKEAIRPDTVLVSVMFANNEVGTIEPIKEIGAVCREAGVLFHTDAVQAAGHIAIDVQEMNIDLLTLTAHKFHGPKGVGAVYIRKGVRIPALVQGGAQENRKRAGTENVPGIVGLGKAAEIACGRLGVFEDRVTRYRDYFISRICSEIPCARINGSLSSRLPGNVSVTFEGIDGSTMLMKLDQKGVFASSGSACTAGSLDPSHVLTAIGRTEKEASQTVRFTIGLLTELDEIDHVLELLREIITELK